MIKNPFDVTKAVDYTNDDIYKYWVDLDKENHGFNTLIEPESLMPKIIVGSKGSGKTHVMKYFSYELQKIRCKAESNTMQMGLANEKFIGIYIRCSGFNSDKFSGKNISDDMWALLYSYFWELWIGERLLDVLIDLQENGSLGDVDESSIVSDILEIFLKPKDGIYSFKELNAYFLELQRNVDYQVQNFMFLGQDKPDVEILLSHSSLTYGIPALLRSKVKFFSNKYILYLIDEMENFSVTQQQLIQTLIREKPVACTFRIGTRPYGIRTLKTLKGVEENRDGSEFKGVVLDEFLRDYKGYRQYVTSILENRLYNSGISLAKNFKISELIEEQTNDDIIRAVAEKKDKQSRSALAYLDTNIKKLNIDDDAAKIIMDNISFPDDILLERTSIMLMYRAIKKWKRNDSLDDLIKSSKEIRDSAKRYYENKDKDTQHARVLEKYKKDLIDSLAREGRVEIPYNGIDKLIDLSCGTPRTILCLLKAAFNNQYYNTGKIPFEEGRKLSIRSQCIGIESTYDWFFEENRIPSQDKVHATDAIMRIGNYLRKARFSDVPPQCSINIFTLNASELSEPARQIFEILVSYSYIVQTDERRQINSDNKTHVYTLNTILYPKYELALAKRGAVNFTAEIAELFFNLTMKDKYDDYVATRLKGYNFPFNINMEEVQSKSLFDFKDQ